MKTKLQVVLFLALLTGASAAPSTVKPSSSPKVAGPSASTSAAKPVPATPPKPAASSDVQSLVRKFAENYYKTKYTGGNAGSQIMSATASSDQPVPVTGWEGRFRTNGSVKLVTSYKGKQQQETHDFDAVTETGKVIDFTAK